MHSPTITLIGAGLAGSLLATTLAQRGFKVTVFERRPDLRRINLDAGRSINLALANRGLHALHTVGQGDAVQKLLIPMRGRALHPLKGELGFQRYGATDTEVINSVSRSALNALLLDAAEATGNVDIHFGQACNGYDFDSSQLQLQDIASGEIRLVDCATLIATDGAGSPIRRAMVAQRGIDAREDLLPHGYKELNLPPAADGSHRLEREALHIWPRGGFMLIALPNLDGSFTVTLFLPMEGGDDSFAALDSTERIEAFFQRWFPDVLEAIPDLLQQFQHNPVGRMITLYAKPWHIGGQALLLGDAAHAIVPFHGQGMNCAFEDCASFGALIDTHGADWPAVFAAFEAERKPNADAIAAMALENYIEMRDLVAQLRFQLQKKLEFALRSRHPQHFIPRYAMVTFSAIPYAEAQSRGRIQQRILDQLTETATTLEQVDMELADRLVEQELVVQ